jgi:hypothetical protein
MEPSSTPCCAGQRRRTTRHNVKWRTGSDSYRPGNEFKTWSESGFVESPCGIFMYGGLSIPHREASYRRGTPCGRLVLCEQASGGGPLGRCCMGTQRPGTGLGRVGEAAAGRTLPCCFARTCYPHPRRRRRHATRREVGLVVRLGGHARLLRRQTPAGCLDLYTCLAATRGAVATRLQAAGDRNLCVRAFRGGGDGSAGVRLPFGN